MVAVSKMTSPLTTQERAKLIALYQVRNSLLWRKDGGVACKGRHETLLPQAIRDCRAKLMNTGSVNDKRRSGRSFGIYGEI